MLNTLDDLIKKYYDKRQPLKFNCVRLIYIENAKKYIGLNRAYVLANCFLNMHSMKSVYNNILLKEIDKYCPDIFKTVLRVPDFYMKSVKSRVE